MSILCRFFFAATVLCVLTACSKKGAASGDASASQSTASGAVGSGTSFVSRGSGACAKYLTPDVVARIIGTPTRPPQSLSPQGCTVARSDDAGAISITLTNANATSFEAYQKYLSNPQPLSGVGDQAVQSTLGIASIKAPNMGCDIDAGGAPGSVKLDRAALGKELGDICNRIYADAR